MVPAWVPNRWSFVEDVSMALVYWFIDVFENMVPLICLCMEG